MNDIKYPQKYFPVSDGWVFLFSISAPDYFKTAELSLIQQNGDGYVVINNEFHIPIISIPPDIDTEKTIYLLGDSENGLCKYFAKLILTAEQIEKIRFYREFLGATEVAL